MLRLLALVLFCCGLSTAHPPDRPPADFAGVLAGFLAEVAALDLPGYGLSYADNLNNIQSPERVTRQDSVFRRYQRAWARVDTASLTANQRVEYAVMGYEIERNLRRIALEQRWHADPPATVPTTRLIDVPHGRDWYRYFLNLWIDRDLEPDSLYAFGLRQIERAELAMRAIQQRSGLDSAAYAEYLRSPQFYLDDTDSLQRAFEAYHAERLATLPAYFPAVAELPPLSIATSDNPRMAQVPGYYTNGTFYYNHFGAPFDVRQIPWLYLHEALPGHHYERSYSRRVASAPSAVAELFNYSAYVEGWGAYVEEIGREIGAYRTDAEEYGKWEWDLVRSLRVPMDVGLNYYGWTDAEALAFWQRHLLGQDDIARREIARMRRWPAQVITYKYGATRFLRRQRAAVQRPDFDWIAFHERILRRGALPLSILEEVVF